MSITRFNPSAIIFLLLVFESPSIGDSLLFGRSAARLRVNRQFRPNVQDVTNPAKPVGPGYREARPHAWLLNLGPTTRAA